MIFLIFLIIIILIILIFFSSPSLSPIPYYPTNKNDLPLILKNLKLINNQVFVDLGAGDGRVIFEAAKEAKRKNLKTKFFAVEKNPFLVFLLFLKRLFHPNKSNIKIVSQDIFSLNLKISPSSFLVFYLYGSPRFLEKLAKHLQKKFSSFTLISYLYPLKTIKPKKIILSQNHPIYFYRI